MPPGYTAFFMWSASAILWWSGWREETAEGIPDAAVAVFLAGWPLAAWRYFPLGEGLQMHGAYAWTALAMIALLWRMDAMRRVTAMSAGFLAGSLGVWMTYSALMYVTPDWASSQLSAAAAGICVCLIVRGASGQIAAVSLGLLLPELLEAIWLAETGPVRIGSAQEMESWWIGVLAARVCSVSAAALRSKLNGSAFRREGGGP